VSISEASVLPGLAGVAALLLVAAGLLLVLPSNDEHAAAETPINRSAAKRGSERVMDVPWRFSPPGSMTGRGQ